MSLSLASWQSFVSLGTGWLMVDWILAGPAPPKPPISKHNQGNSRNNPSRQALLLPTPTESPHPRPAPSHYPLPLPAFHSLPAHFACLPFQPRLVPRAPLCPPNWASCCSIDSRSRARFGSGPPPRPHNHTTPRAPAGGLGAGGIEAPNRV